MKKITAILFVLPVILAACSKTDPILPGVRTDIFPTAEISVSNTEIPSNRIGDVIVPESGNFKQDNQNVVYDGERKIFSGLATMSSVAGTRAPTSANGFAYAGLSTGEIVKINPRNRNIAWIADVYANSNMTGGFSVLDIVAPVVVADSAVYVGGLGGEFCRLRDSNGKKQWCLPLSVGVPFIIAGKTAFVVSSDNFLYAVDTDNGKIFWRSSVKKQSAPKISNGIITVGKERFIAATGAIQP